MYYVDGARPSPGAEDSDTGEGCVPWSPDRPDVHICGEVEEGFTPAPTPGGYADYKQVCDQAAQVFQERVKDLVRLCGLEATPAIDLASCGAGGRGSAQENRWLVKFALANADEVSPYRSAWVVELELDAAEGGSAEVALQESLWPPA